MAVTSIVITTIVVFILVDLLLRFLLGRVRAAQARREREQALHTGLQLDVREEAPTLKRVELDHPKACILAVDDESIVLDSLRKMLVLGGYSVDTVESGAEALGLVRKRDYDFVFTDLKMPGMDGVRLTQAVRHVRPDIDVVVITGYGTIDSAVETVRLGAMDYVQKPFTEDELLEFVQTAVIRREAQLDSRMRHRIRLVRPGTGESRSKFELNVPAGAFVSPQHAWARVDLNGTVRIGPDDLVRKIFGRVKQIELPEPGRPVAKGEPLFSLDYGDYVLRVPAPISGRVTRINAEHAEHPEWLEIKPFELTWMCAVDPSNLAAELQGLRIGRDAVDWYQSELDRYGALLRETLAESSPAAAGTPVQQGEGARTHLMAAFAEPFLRAGEPT